MSVIFGNYTNTTIGYYASRKEVKVITKIKYGGLQQLKSMPLVIECTFGDMFEPKLIEHHEINKLSFSGKIPKNKKRAKTIFKLEEKIIKEYGSYIPIRIDLSLPSYSKYSYIYSKDYIDFIRSVSGNLRHNDLNDRLAGWFYAIENNKNHIPHAHWNILLRGDRYLFLNEKDKELLFKEDINLIAKTITDYLSYKEGAISDCEVNILDISDQCSRKKVVLITKDDYLLRNCARAWFTYICKKNKNYKGIFNNSREFGRSFVKKEKESELFRLVDSFDKLLDHKTCKAICNVFPGLEFHTNRIQDLFKVEDEVASQYREYIMLPFKIVQDITPINLDDPGAFLKKFNNYKTSVPIINNSYICYVWMLNQIENKTEFNFCPFFNVSNNAITTVHDISKIISHITKWIRDMNNSLSKAIIIEPLPNIDDKTYSLDYKQRNKLRVKIATISVTENERIDMDGRNYRLYGKSQVRPNTLL